MREGNIHDDPMFANIQNEDFNLQSNSPCIDAGDPDLDGDGIEHSFDSDDQDLDGTRLDMGALYYHQGAPLYYGPTYHVSIGF